MDKFVIMTDAELIEWSEPVIARTRSTCRMVLNLVDLVGEGRALEMMQSPENSLRYSRSLFKRMLAAARSSDDIEFFRIALQVDKENPGEFTPPE